MAIIPTPNGQITVTSSGPDWQGLVKTAALIAAFLGSLAYLYFGHPDTVASSEATSIVISTGAALWGLTISDKVANILTVRAFLNSPGALKAGVVVQPPGTTLITGPQVGMQP